MRIKTAYPFSSRKRNEYYSISNEKDKTGRFLLNVNLPVLSDDRTVLLLDLQSFRIFSQLRFMPFARNKVFFDISAWSRFQPFLSGTDNFDGTGIFMFVVPYLIQAWADLRTVERDLCGQFSPVVVEVPDVHLRQFY